MFVAPNWFEEMLIQFGIYVLIPIIVAIIIGLIVKRRRDSKSWGILSIGVSFIVMILIMMPVGSVIWYYGYETPSV